MEKENQNPKIRKQTPTKKTNLDLNEIKELESLKEIGCIDFETSSFNFGTDISIYLFLIFLLVSQIFLVVFQVALAALEEISKSCIKI